MRKFLVTNFLTKVGQIFGNFLGYCEQHYFSCKNCCGFFLYLVWKIWATFYSNIWSHCRQHFFQKTRFFRAAKIKISFPKHSTTLVDSFLPKTKQNHRLPQLKLDTQKCSHLVVDVCIQRDMCTLPHPHQHGTPPRPGAMPRLLQEQAGRWCH